MIKVLVVEDDGEKLRRVLTCLQTVSACPAEAIDNVRDIIAAKRLLRERRYDLLILDMMVPPRPDEPPFRDAGLGLLDEILERDLYFVPRHIIGLTAHEDALTVAEPRFAADVLQVIYYDPTTTDWADRLRRALRRIVLTERGGETVPEYATQLCIITAIASPELEAVLALPWDWQTLEIPTDPTVYHRGRYRLGDSTYEVTAAAAPRMGMTAAAVLATKMALTFRPRYLAMVGILAGIRGKCEIGDILVADPSWDYESGKRTLNEGGSTFLAAPHQVGLDSFLRGKMLRMIQDQAVIDAIRRGWMGPQPATSLRMLIGPIASGAAVLEDSTVTENIKQQHRKTIGVEMETYGVLAAAEEMPLPQPKAFSIKSVCDFADPTKNDDHQKYAAYTSASALRCLMESYLG